MTNMLKSSAAAIIEAALDWYDAATPLARAGATSVLRRSVGAFYDTYDNHCKGDNLWDAFSKAWARVGQAYLERFAADAYKNWRGYGRDVALWLELVPVVDAAVAWREGTDYDGMYLSNAVDKYLRSNVPPETTHSITEWADATFGIPRTCKSIFDRAMKEMCELGEALDVDDESPDAPEEIADVVIILARLLARHGVDLQDVVNAKMTKNRERKWRLTGDGHGQHVKETP